VSLFTLGHIGQALSPLPLPVLSLFAHDGADGQQGKHSRSGRLTKGPQHPLSRSKDMETGLVVSTKP
jgi:hypothetical protein